MLRREEVSGPNCEQIKPQLTRFFIRIRIRRKSSKSTGYKSYDPDLGSSRRSFHIAEQEQSWILLIRARRLRQGKRDESRPSFGRIFPRDDTGAMSSLLSHVTRFRDSNSARARGSEMENKGEIRGQMLSNFLERAAVPRRANQTRDEGAKESFDSFHVRVRYPGKLRVSETSPSAAVEDSRISNWLPAAAFAFLSKVKRSSAAAPTVGIIRSGADPVFAIIKNQISFEDGHLERERFSSTISLHQPETIIEASIGRRPNGTCSSARNLRIRARTYSHGSLLLSSLVTASSFSETLQSGF